MDKQQRSEVLKAYEAYLKAFIASDMATINSLERFLLILNRCGIPTGAIL